MSRVPLRVEPYDILVTTAEQPPHRKLIENPPSMIVIFHTESTRFSNVLEYACIAPVLIIEKCHHKMAPAVAERLSKLAKHPVAIDSSGLIESWFQKVSCSVQDL